MNRDDWLARAEAYEEAARHLDLHWTDNVRERDQGDIIGRKLVAEGMKCRRIAEGA